MKQNVFRIKENNKQRFKFETFLIELWRECPVQKLFRKLLRNQTTLFTINCLSFLFFTQHIRDYLKKKKLNKNWAGKKHHCTHLIRELSLILVQRSLARSRPSRTHWERNSCADFRVGQVWTQRPVTLCKTGLCNGNKMLNNNMYIYMCVSTTPKVTAGNNSTVIKLL